MIRTDVFEGWYDVNPQWEFDMPVYMIKPISGYSEANNIGGVDELIEEYQINISNEDEIYDYFENCDDYEKRSVKIMFSKAKNNKARKGVYYWKKVIEWNTETFEQKLLEDITIGKE